MVTATPSTTDTFTEIVDAFKAELIAPHILALNRQSMEAFAPLAEEGVLYFIPHTNGENAGVSMKSRRTWLVDTLHAIYSRMFRYRAKVWLALISLMTSLFQKVFILRLTKRPYPSLNKKLTGLFAWMAPLDL